VSKLGVTDLIFVDPGINVNGEYYREVQQELLPAIPEMSGNFFVFQQDSAPAHRARDNRQLLQRDTPEFIAPDLWPPNSPDLNPVDYKIWGMMQQGVYQTRIRDITKQKEHLIDVWHGMQQSVVDEAIDEWRKCLRACSCQRRTFRALNLDLMYTICLGVGFITDCISYPLTVLCFHPRVEPSLSSLMTSDYC